ncbi:MAG TPA: PPOX class F420-dependent oxidoreductase [Anaerolineae bacterium]|nr:PPOX class F420-dependent oxidoreductase [Anaerolineae bacterium]
MLLTDKQRQFLNQVHFAVVSTIAPDGLPHQTVMWYMLDGDELLLSTPRGSVKHKHLRRDPRLSVCVEQGYTYITLTGTVTLDENPATTRADYQRLGQRYRNTFNVPSSPPRGGGGRVQDLLSRERVTLRMRIERVQSNGLD